MISIIVAIASNFAIGKNNELLWHIPEDLKRFKRITTGHKVVMGRNTYLSLPYRPLKNRENIVITDHPEEKFEGCTMVNSIAEAMALCDPQKENFIIGGASVYRQFLSHSDRLYLTLVDKEFDGDVHFPELDFSEWNLVSREDHPDDGRLGFSYSYLVLDRKND